MEALGVVSTFRFPFFLPNKLAFRRPPPAASTPFRSPPPPYLSHAPPRRLAVPCLVRPAPPAPDEDEARAILRHFLKADDDGIRIALEEKRALEILELLSLLSSKLRSLHELEQQLGVQLAQPQLIDLFTPYLTSILKRYDDDIRIIGGDGQLSSTALVGERKVEEAQTRWIRKKREGIAQLEMQLSEGCPSPHVLYLMNVGLDLRQIRSMVRLYPYLESATLKQRLDRVMEFLISLGVYKSRVPAILCRRPHLIFISIEGTMMPSMEALESKGVDKAKWPIIINQCPAVLTLAKAKVEAIVEYFSEMGLSETAIGRLLTFSPQLLCSSIEAKIKPVNRFLLDNGFTMEEIRGILLRTGSIYTINLERSLKPKWEFWLKMGYPKSELLKYPFYFTYSLERRIKPRYELAAKQGIRCSLSTMLATNNARFENIIRRKMHHVAIDSLI